jgi:glutaredoxin
MNVMIYTKDNCHFCTNAKALLATKGIGYTEMKLNEDFTREYLVENYPSAKSFPLIIIDGFYIGGYEQLKNKLNESSDTTQKLLNEGNVA